jgi:antitoxin VapB
MRTVKLFRNGGSQAIRIPKEYAFKSAKVSLTRTERGLLVQPCAEGVGEWFHSVKFSDDFFLKGRKQPAIQKREQGN